MDQQGSDIWADTPKMLGFFWGKPTFKMAKQQTGLIVVLSKWIQLQTLYIQL